MISPSADSLTSPRASPRAPAVGEAWHERRATVAFSEADRVRRAAWERARFGCFVHWGLPAIPAGHWAGGKIPGLAEWIQFRARIPLAQYRRLAAEFNPQGFDAREWVRRAAEAGMRYFVYTAKHHDGFAMYRSRVSAYNVCDATPFRRDPLAEIAEACREHGLLLGIYYSQMIDWESPDAIGPEWNDWDFDPARADFGRYWRDKAMPQLRELLTHYGPVGVVWFDMPSGLPRECAREASDLVRQLQPGAVINSRLGGGGQADYHSMDDNYFNNHLPARDWETAATTNATWAYARQAGGWKPVEALIEALVYAVSRGGNYLLNLGPDATGAFPAEAGAQFAGLARWTKTAAPAIHGAGASPFAQSFGWGHVTSRGDTLYLHLFRGGRAVSLPGLKTRPQLARLLETGADCALTGNGVSLPIGIRLPDSAGAFPAVVELVFAEKPVVSARPAQAAGEALQLDIWQAERGNPPGVFRWTFDLAESGEWRVVILTKETFSNEDPHWDAGGLGGTLVTSAGRTEFSLKDDGREDYPIIHYWKRVRSEVGTLIAAQAGETWLELRDLPVADSKWETRAANVVGLRLEPMGRTPI